MKGVLFPTNERQGGGVAQERKPTFSYDAFVNQSRDDV